MISDSDELRIESEIETVRDKCRGLVGVRLGSTARIVPR